jgi:hypothetical protein
MDKIDNNKLITIFLYAGIIILLTSILYNMYIDYLSENYFNLKKYNLKEKFTDSDINEKLKYINIISNSKKKSIPKIQEIKESFSQVLEEPLLQKPVIETPRFYPFSENINIEDKTYQKLMQI